MFPDMKFEYAVKFPDGKYYTGRVNTDESPNNWKGEKHEAFTYTEKGAHTKIAKSNSLLALCTVEKVI